MAVYYYVARPVVATVVQWTGTNFSEVEGVMGNNAWMESGTLMANIPGQGATPLTVGQWLSPGLTMVMDVNNYDNDTYQVVSSAGLLDFTVTDA